MTNLYHHMTSFQYNRDHSAFNSARNNPQNVNNFAHNHEMLLILLYNIKHIGYYDVSTLYYHVISFQYPRQHSKLNST